MVIFIATLEIVHLRVCSIFHDFLSSHFLGLNFIDLFLKILIVII